MVKSAVVVLLEKIVLLLAANLASNSEKSLSERCSFLKLADVPDRIAARAMNIDVKTYRKLTKGE